MPRKLFTRPWQAPVAAVLAIAAVIAIALITTLPTRSGDPAPGRDEPAPGRDEPAAYTKWYVQQAIDRYEREGRQAALDYYNAGGGVDGAWYIFILDAQTERYAAHATIPNGVGDDANLDVDVTGYPYGAAILEATEDGIWVDYVFMDLSINEGRRKHAWVVRRDDLIFGAGWYESTYFAAPPTKDEPGAYTKRLVQEAAWRYEIDRQQAIDYYNTPESVDGEWYVFILDEAGELLAHADPGLLGESLTGPLGTDVTGYDFGSVMMEAPESGVWVDYVFVNPATGEQGVKHSWVIEYKGHIFGSGWYESPPAEEAPTPEEPGAYTKWYVQQALDRYEREGRQAALDYYNAGGDADGPWYIFVADVESGALVAHSAFPSRVGKDTGSLKDVTGYPYGKEILSATEEGGWIEYVFLDPVTNRGKKKHSWVARRDDLVFGAGWYESSYEQEPATKAEPGAYTKQLVEKALWRYVGEGRQAVIDYYNTPESVDGEWYVFIFDEAGELLAHADPGLLGESLTGPLGTDVTGYDFGSVMLEAPESGVWVDYMFENPATGEQGVKHSWVIEHEGLFFGSGWYEEG